VSRARAGMKKPLIPTALWTGGYMGLTPTSAARCARAGTTAPLVALMTERVPAGPGGFRVDL
jgi:hypothetical protein